MKPVHGILTLTNAFLESSLDSPFAVADCVLKYFMLKFLVLGLLLGNLYDAFTLRLESLLFCLRVSLNIQHFEGILEICSNGMKKKNLLEIWSV